MAEAGNADVPEEPAETINLLNLLDFPIEPIYDEAPHNLNLNLSLAVIIEPPPLVDPNLALDPIVEQPPVLIDDLTLALGPPIQPLAAGALDLAIAHPFPQVGEPMELGQYVQLQPVHAYPLEGNQDNVRMILSKRLTPTDLNNLVLSGANLDVFIADTIRYLRSPEVRNDRFRGWNILVRLVRNGIQFAGGPSRMVPPQQGRAASTRILWTSLFRGGVPLPAVGDQIYAWSDWEPLGNQPPRLTVVILLP